MCKCNISTYQNKVMTQSHTSVKTRRLHNAHPTAHTHTHIHTKWIKENVQTRPDQTADNAGLQTRPLSLISGDTQPHTHTHTHTDRREKHLQRLIWKNTPPPLSLAPPPPTLPIYIQRPSINLSLAQTCLWSTALSSRFEEHGTTNSHERGEERRGEERRGEERRGEERRGEERRGEIRWD